MSSPLANSRTARCSGMPRPSPTTPVGVDDDLRRWLSHHAVRDGRPSLSAALAVATQFARLGLHPGGGQTSAYFTGLMTAGLVDATLARVVEPHLDAQAILLQAAIHPTIPDIGSDVDSTWGVYAANAPTHHLEARRNAAGWTLSGTKPWCSLAGVVSHAIITAEVPGAGSRAFAVRLDPERVETLPGQWVSRGLADVVGTGIRLDHLPAIPVGDTNWYLDRPGFSWGAIGVAAAWYGIALGLLDDVKRGISHRGADQIAFAQIGAADHELFAAQVCLQHAAAEIDAGLATGNAGELLSLRVRAVVARTAHNMLALAGQALGPGPMTSDESHARRIADLGVYIRQHHGERDLARLGEYCREADR
jgi:alkylation response protein AidB-like acyl-CoA dehydrogenase